MTDITKWRWFRELEYSNLEIMDWGMRTDSALIQFSSTALEGLVFSENEWWSRSSDLEYWSRRGGIGTSERE